MYRRIGKAEEAQRCLEFLDYWGRAEWGDNHCLLQPARDLLAEDCIDTLICGHSHQPGMVRFPGGLYVNAGSWTYGDATYVVYDGRVSGRAGFFPITSNRIHLRIRMHFLDKAA